METAVAVVPAIWPFEAANVLLVNERKGRSSREKGESFINFLSELPIQINTSIQLETLSELNGLARHHQLSSYDAAYLFIALRERLPIATMDQPLKRAAKREGVKLYRP